MFRTQNLYPGSKNIFELRQFNAWIRNVKQKYGWTAISLVIFALPSSSSETEGLLAGTMRYFLAKVYFKSRRAPGNLFLTNQFQERSNSVPLIGQKIFFCPMSGTEFDFFWNWFG